jgi:subtilase family serine protease
MNSSMKKFSQCLQNSLFHPLSLSLLAALAVLTAGATLAQAAGQEALSSPAIRIGAEVSSSNMTALPGTKRPTALAQYDTGRLVAGTKLQGVSIYFSRSQAQEADLKLLMAAQQNPASPSYHKWLTPDQFAARFGMADTDIAKVQSWLEQQGFSVDLVNRSRNMIRFSGTASQVEQAFVTEMHSYAVKTAKGTVNHFGPSTALSVPSALAGVVESVHNLDDFRPHSHVVLNTRAHVKPRFTGNDEGTQYTLFAPGDIATVYDIQNEYANYTGTGQSIAIVGQSQIVLSDIEAFQSAAGLPVKDPNLIVVPGTGTPSISAGDETESDLDLEWSGAIAKGATISLVYTGNASNSGAFDAIEYAIDEKIANIVSSSYGTCEADLSGFSLESVFEQAATQGQTVLSAAGDDGSSDCFGTSGFTTAQQEALAVDYPGTSPNVTSVGGTEVMGGDELNSNGATTNTYLLPGDGYWNTEPTINAAAVTTALKYIPEQAWNEDTTCLEFYDPSEGGSPICAGGGGASSLFPKPSWQAGVSGIPSDGKRDVPDVSLNAAIYAPGYLLCTSDQSAWDIADGQVASCNDGFLDGQSLIPTVAGGTSFAAPIFAGMIALINQQQGYTTGQGLINPTLYTLAANSSTYASAFHDITTGNNDCLSSGYCSGSAETEYAAGTGYDLATGLGSVDLYNLANAWPANGGSGVGLVATTTTVSATNTAPTVNTSDTFTITVASGSGTPTGTVSITVDSNAAVTEMLTLNGTVTYPYTFTTAGSHTVLAAYAGDSTFAASTGSITVTAGGTSSGTGTFSFTPTPTSVSVAQGATGTSTISVTPASGYTGTVNVTLTGTSNNTALENLCYEFSNGTGTGTAVITGTAVATTQLSLDTNAADCATAAAVAKTGKHSIRNLLQGHASNTPMDDGIKTAPATIAFAGLMLAGFLGRFSKKFRSLAGVIVLVAIGFAISACGGSSSTTISDPPAGTYTLDLQGQDSSSATIPTETTTVTLTIQ